PGSLWPDGTQKYQLFALRGDYSDQDPNNPVTKIPLTINDATLQWSAQWKPGDLEMSLKCRRWSSADPGAIIVEAGSYSAAIEFDASGNIAGLASQPPALSIPFPMGPDGWPNLS